MGTSKRANRIPVYNIQVFLATTQPAALSVMAASPTWQTVLCTYWLHCTSWLHCQRGILYFARIGCIYFWSLLMTIHETGCSRPHYCTLVAPLYIGCIVVRRLHDCISVRRLHTCSTPCKPTLLKVIPSIHQHSSSGSPTKPSLIKMPTNYAVPSGFVKMSASFSSEAT